MRCFLLLWNEFRPFFLDCGVSNWKLICTRHEFNSNNFIFTALNLLVRRLSFKTQFKIEFLGPFYGPRKPRNSLKKPCQFMLVNFRNFEIINRRKLNHISQFYLVAIKYKTTTYNENNYFLTLVTAGCPPSTAR